MYIQDFIDQVIALQRRLEGFQSALKAILHSVILFIIVWPIIAIDSIVQCHIEF